MQDEAWNDKRIDMLKMLWAQGDTATAIGTRMVSKMSHKRRQSRRQVTILDPIRYAPNP